MTRADFVQQQWRQLVLMMKSGVVRTPIGATYDMVGPVVRNPRSAGDPVGWRVLQRRRTPWVTGQPVTAGHQRRPDDQRSTPSLTTAGDKPSSVAEGVDPPVRVGA